MADIMSSQISWVNIEELSIYHKIFGWTIMNLWTERAGVVSGDRFASRDIRFNI